MLNTFIYGCDIPTKLKLLEPKIVCKYLCTRLCHAEPCQSGKQSAAVLRRHPQLRRNYDLRFFLGSLSYLCLITRISYILSKITTSPETKKIKKKKNARCQILTYNSITTFSLFTWVGFGPGKTPLFVVASIFVDKPTKPFLVIRRKKILTVENVVADHPLKGIRILVG